jgi:hypothetical protein
MGRVRFNARENGQISPSTTVWASGGAGNRRHLASVLQEGRNRRIVTPVRESSGESRVSLVLGPVRCVFVRDRYNYSDIFRK